MVAFADDPRRGDALANDIYDISQKLNVQKLVKHGHEWVGPCPECFGTDRFSISVRKQLFYCRGCQAKGDVIALVMWLQRLSFPEALTWLCGPSQELSAQERAARDAAYEAKQKERDAEEARYRARAIADARVIWKAGVAAEDSPVRDYLTRRGIPRDLYPRMPVALRFHPDLPFMAEAGPGRWRELHRGPAMVAAVQGPDGKFCAVHRTWLDLGQPKGKAVICHPDTGEVLPSKKVLGSKKGGAIRLATATSGTLVMGEGIETTLSACVAGAVPGASYWAGVDLGNMSGQRQLGKGLRFAGIPDLDDGLAFVPPPWVTLLIYVQDGDSDPKDTRAKLLAGLRRAIMLRPGLKAQLVHPGAGVDLNDVLLRGAPVEGNE